MTARTWYLQLNVILRSGHIPNIMFHLLILQDKLSQLKRFSVLTRWLTWYETLMWVAKK